MASVVNTSVKRSVTVNASLEHAFAVFTDGFDTWWPRSHHIGKSPMKRSILEGKVGGRCYTEQQDGSESDWGQVLEWDPPHRLLLAWQITHEWGFQPDLARASEVEIRFTPEAGGTRVDLEHRHFERMGPGAEVMRNGISGPGGWTGLLEMFKARAEVRSS